MPTGKTELTIEFARQTPSLETREPEPRRPILICDADSRSSSFNTQTSCCLPIAGTMAQRDFDLNEN